MESAYFAGLDRHLSPLILGAWKFERRQIATALGLLWEWYQLGGNMIDTAAAYGAGESEAIIGDWLSQIPSPESMTVISKGCHSSGSGLRSLSRQTLLSDLDGSLRRLQREPIDIYLLHRDDPDVPVGELMETLNEQVEAGRISLFGASNWSISRLTEASAYAAEHGIRGFACSSPQFSLAVPNEPYWPLTVSASDAASRQWYERERLPLFSWSPLARGYFSKPLASHQRDPDLERVFSSPGNEERRRRAYSLAAKRGVTPSQIALAWVLSQPIPVKAVIGPESTAEVRESVDATRLHLSNDEASWLELSTNELTHC